METRAMERIMYVMIVLTFLIPLCVIPAFIFPFVVPKVVLFRTVVVAMSFGYLLLLFHNWQRHRPRITPITIVVGIYLLSFGISTLFGVDVYRSVWDTHERMLGFFTIVHYALYYLILTSLVREWPVWRIFCRWFLFGGMVVMIVGLWQRFIDPNFLFNGNAGRVVATLGNSIYVSGYGLFLFFLGVLLFFGEKKRGSAWMWLGHAGAFFGAVGILIGGSRGTMVAVLSAVVFLFFWYLCVMSRKYGIVRNALMLIGVITIFFFGIAFFYREHPLVRDIPAFGPLLNTSIIEGTAHTRMIAWQVAFEAWKKYPVFGWGPNNYYYAFNLYYRPELLRYGIPETWFDNAHNMFLQTLATQGSVGFIAYLSLFAFGVRQLWRGYRVRRIDHHVAGIGIAFLLAHAVHNMFVFENITSYLFFFFFLAFINNVTSNQARVEETSIIGPRVSVFPRSVGTVPIALLVLFVVYTTNIQPAYANIITRRLFENAVSYGGPANAYRLILEKAHTPHIDDIRGDLARVSIEIAEQVISAGGDVSFLPPLLYRSYNELEKSIERHPMDVRLYSYASATVRFLFLLTNDSTYLSSADTMLTTALQYSPKRQQLHSQLAQIKIHAGKIDEAVLHLREAIDADPTISLVWFDLISLHGQVGDLHTARTVLEEALKNGVVFSPDEEKRIFPLLMSPVS